MARVTILNLMQGLEQQDDNFRTFVICMYEYYGARGQRSSRIPFRSDLEPQGAPLELWDHLDVVKCGAQLQMIAGLGVMDAGTTWQPQPSVK